MSFFPMTRQTRPEDVTLWHITGQNPQPELTKAPNIMGKTVAWFRDKSVPSIQKISLVALGALATLALGWIIGKVLLVCMVVTVITLLWAKKEASAIDKKEQNRLEQIQEAVRIFIEQKDAYNRMKGIFGGAEAFNQIPKLDLGDKMGSTGYIDFLRPAALSHSIMQGCDKFGRPFIAMKIKDKQAPTDEPHVLVLFQRYRQGGKWVYSSSLQATDQCLNCPLKQEDLNQIAQMVQNTHTRLAVV